MNVICNKPTLLEIKLEKGFLKEPRSLKQVLQPIISLVYEGFSEELLTKGSMKNFQHPLLSERGIY